MDTRSLGPFCDYIGLEITAATPDEVTATWEATPRLHQPFGIVNGGVHCTVVETLASMAGALWLDSNRAEGRSGNVVGVNNNTDFFRAVSEGTLHSVARPLHRGRSQQVWVVETTNEDGKLVARGQVRLQNLES